MTKEELETIYEALARAVDAVGDTQAEIYLAKVALALAETTGDASLALSVIEECKAGIAD